MATPQKHARGRGRPRDEAARQRILKAALDLMDETAFAQVTAEAIAERAGTSKATLYRWWPNKAAVVIEAFRQAVAPELPLQDTGSLREDLTTQVPQLRPRPLGTRRAHAAIFHGGGAQRSRSGGGLPVHLERSAARGSQGRCCARSRPADSCARTPTSTWCSIRYTAPSTTASWSKMKLPSQKYAEALAELVIRGLVG